MPLGDLSRWERAEQLAATIALAPAGRQDPTWRKLATRALDRNRKAGPNADLKILTPPPKSAPSRPPNASPATEGDPGTQDRTAAAIDAFRNT